MTLLALLAAYVLGSIPTGLWLGQALRGIDIREHGSKNIGATNTLRSLGTKLGVVALAGDMAKGALAAVIGMQMSDWYYAPLACGLAAVIGHTAPIFLKFKGGKGVATSAGVFLALAPIATSIAILTFVVIVSVTRMVSAASICAALALAISVWAFDYDNMLRLVACIVVALVIIRHRENIQRILTGTENRF